MKKGRQAGRQAGKQAGEQAGRRMPEEEGRVSTRAVACLTTQIVLTTSH